MSEFLLLKKIHYGIYPHKDLRYVFVSNQVPQNCASGSFPRERERVIGKLWKYTSVLPRVCPDRERET